jgi:hypothetical protein
VDDPRYGRCWWGRSVVVPELESRNLSTEDTASARRGAARRWYLDHIIGTTDGVFEGTIRRLVV